MIKLHSTWSGNRQTDTRQENYWNACACMSRVNQSCVTTDNHVHVNLISVTDNCIVLYTVDGKCLW